MNRDEFGDRMKSYELEYEKALPDDQPFIARIDGRCFSGFTRPFDRPFDHKMTKAMVKTTISLVETMHAKIGYTQSDEITLIFEPTETGDMLFGGRILKLASVLASATAAHFMVHCPYKGRAERRRPHFDCRVFSVPDRTEAANALLWRAQDCRKNAVQSIARSEFSHKSLHKKSTADMLQMLEDKGIWLEQYPLRNVYGSFLQRKTRLRTLTDAEFNSIPEVNRPSSREVMRSSVVPLDITYFGDVKNREAVIFDSEDAVYG